MIATTYQAAGVTIRIQAMGTVTIIRVGDDATGGAWSDNDVWHNRLREVANSTVHRIAEFEKAVRQERHDRQARRYIASRNPARPKWPRIASQTSRPRPVPIRRTPSARPSRAPCVAYRAD